MEHVFDFTQKIERIPHFTVEFVDEGDDGGVSHAADVQKLDRLSFHTLGGIDHHHGGVHRRQHAVRIFGEVFVPRGIQEVDDVILVFELHHRTRHRDTALLFNFHPVTRRVTARFTPLHGARHLNGAPEQKEFFSQRRFTGVRVRNNGKRTAAFDFAENRLFGHG